MGAAASKTQDDRRIMARIKADMPSHGASGLTARHSTRHSHPSSRRQLQHSMSAPAGVPGQAQFGYLIQQIGEDPNQVQVTPGYYCMYTYPFFHLFLGIRRKAVWRWRWMVDSEMMILVPAN